MQRSRLACAEPAAGYVYGCSARITRADKAAYHLLMGRSESTEKPGSRKQRHAGLVASYDLPLLHYANQQTVETSK